MESALITVRFWAGAREAAGVAEITRISAKSVSLPVLVDHVLDTVSPERRDRLSRVVAACSVLIDGQGIAGRAPEEVLIEPGQTVELLPPFAGG